MRESAEPRVGLACAGGVVEGAFYEVGALAALADCVEGLDLNRLDAYVGVSSGAIVASCLANGIAPHDLCEGMLSHVDAVLRAPPERFFAPAYGDYVRHLSRLPGAAASLLGSTVRHPRRLSLASALMDLGPALPPGLFDGAALERYVAHLFATAGRTNDFRRLAATLRVVAVDLDSSELVVFGQPPMDHVPISRAVQASAALPILFAPAVIGGRHYVDGVVRRTVHATQALDAGVTLLFCINPIVPLDLPSAARRGAAARRHVADYGPWAVFSQAFRTLIHSRMEVSIRNYARVYPDAEILLLEPAREEEEQLFFSNIFSSANREAVCDYGYRSTQATLRRRAKRLAPVLERHGMRLRPAALRRRPRRPA